MKLNVYLDIDGVLLVNENHAANFADEFLQAVLSRYPDSTYWLTTHVWQDEHRAIDVLKPYLKPETVRLLDKIKPTQWDEWKTDGIDFAKPFLWFDDDLFNEEREALIKHNALDSWIEVDLRKNDKQLRKLMGEFFGA